VNLIQEGLKLQQAIVDANAKAADEQETRDRMRGKHQDRKQRLPSCKINGSTEWYDSGHGAGDFK
jgi:hypothetical protein